MQPTHSICCFCPLIGTSTVGFKVPLELVSAKASTRVAASYPPQLCVKYAVLWLNATTSRVANLMVFDSNAYKGQHGPKVLQSNASVSLLPKSKREDKEAENDIHVGGLRCQARLCTWFQVGNQLDAGCVIASTLRSSTTDATKLTRLFGQADFQGPPLKLVEEVPRPIREEFTLEPIAQCPSRPLGCPATFEWMSFVE